MKKAERLLGVVAFDVGLNQRRMRKRTLSIVNIRIRVVVEQNQGCVTVTSRGMDYLWSLVNKEKKPILLWIFY